MKKNVVAALSLVVIAGLLVTGCSKKESSTAAAADKPVTLTVWCWDPTFNIFAMNTAAEIYKRDHPNVTVNVVETPWNDLQPKLIAALSSNQTENLPDIVLTQDNAIQKNMMNYPEAFLPVNGKVDLSQFAVYKSGYGLVDGKNYSVPFDNGASCTFLRRDIIEKAGLKVEDFRNAL